MHGARNAARALLATLLAVAAVGVAAPPAGAGELPAGVTLEVTGGCGPLISGFPDQPYDLEVVSDGAPLTAVTVVPVMPAGIVATPASTPPANVPAHHRWAFRFDLSVAGSVPAGTVEIAFDVTVDGVTVRRSWPKTVRSRPSAPTGVTATAGDTTATVSWTAPVVRDRPDATLGRYTITALPGGATTEVVNVTTAVVAGLTNGTSYTFTVTTYGYFGETTSDPSNAVVPAGAPAAPEGVTATGPGGSRTVSWEAADPNGSPVTGYTVTAYPSGNTFSVGPDARSTQVGTADAMVADGFTVRATNAVGTGPESRRTDVPAPAVPGAFAGTVLVNGGDAAIFAGVGDTGPDPSVTGYDVDIRPAGYGFHLDRPATDGPWTGGIGYGGGFTNNTTQYVRARATNAAGAGPWSAAVTGTPSGKPYGPELLVVPRDGSVSFCLLGAAGNGKPVTQYEVSTSNGELVAGVDGSARTGRVTGLDNGQWYSFVVRARNANGLGYASSPTYAVTPSGPPAAPPWVTAAPSGEDPAAAVVSWQQVPAAPGYTVTASPGGARVDVPGNLASATVTGLDPDTAYTFDVRGWNSVGAGAATTSDEVRTPDTVAPVVTIDAKPPAVSSSPGVSVPFTATDGHAVTTTCALDGGTAAPCTSPVAYTGLADGSHTVAVTATDPSGNAGSASVTWRVDTVDPTVTITSGPPGMTALRTASVTFTADEAGVTYTCAFDNDAPVPCTSPAGYTGVADGTHHVTVTGTDLAGNTGSDGVTWHVDPTLPWVAVTKQPKSYTTARDAAVEFEATPGTTTCAFDGGTAAPCTSPLSYTGLADGTHTVVVTIADGDGRTGTATATWHVDNAAPALSFTAKPPAATQATAANLSFGATDASPLTYSCALDGAQPATCDGGTASYTGLAEGEHTLHVVVTDAALNASSADATWRVDTTAPGMTMNEGPDAVTASRSATFAFGADETATFACALDGAAAAACTSPKTFTGLADGDHTLVVTATDTAGNADHVDRTWHVDGTAPKVTVPLLPAFTLTSTAGVAYGATDGSGVASYDVRYRGAPWNAGFGPFQYPPAWQGTTATARSLAATAGATYCFSVRARGTLGTVSAWSAERCTARPLDDRALAAGTGWGRGTGASDYLGTFTGTSTVGAVLTRTGVQARRLALVARTCAGCATVGIYVDGTLVKQVGLASAATAYRKVFTVDLGSVRSGTVTIRTLTAGRAYVDGLGTSRV
ncbi:MAG TPA: fibronectin type III domain-containing protein [Mycobacteriales bacterium]|jgi:hypothetical protein|nr:fibronectin type III domain-containing protein [Mycobacteriales bacterium]